MTLHKEPLAIFPHSKEICAILFLACSFPVSREMFLPFYGINIHSLTGIRIPYRGGDLSSVGSEK